MSNWQKTTIIFFIGTMGIVYLMVSAPPPLPDEQKTNSPRYPVNEMFVIVSEENNAVRSLYTKEIVEQGKLRGLRFSEDWQLPTVEAGPLPALFLRSIAVNLEKSPEELSLFLGSDHPISQANRFSHQQQEMFQKIRIDKKPQFFFDKELQRYIGMFPDYAVSPGCVNCHNSHPKSMKKDWKLGDIMGATTWMYPKDSITLEEIRRIVKQFRTSTSKAYEDYLDKTLAFKDARPNVDSLWPRNGLALPEKQIFMDSVFRKTSRKTLDAFLH